ncbi:hypothetical protein ABW20_dc0110428 [Dactylellina cionopaga]|nr:hypothetical protein ABW20_dc0110428 [Dactylellina cionopaga]
MQLLTIAKIVSFAAIILPAIAAPFAELEAGNSPDLRNQIFPRDALCTCCRPASTITLSSTKLFVSLTTETVYTTSTKVQVVKALATTTYTPFVTRFITVTTVFTTSSTPAPTNGGTTTTTITWFETFTLPTLVTETVTPAAATQTTYTLIGGTHFWKRDGEALVRRALPTLTDCGCVNVECMTAVAITEKVTITSISTKVITKPAETGVLLFTTTTQWKTLSIKATSTATEISTITNTAIALPTDEVSVTYEATSTIIFTTTVSDGPQVPETTTVTATVNDITTTVSYTQVAYFPSGTVVINGHGDAPATDTPENQTEAFSIDRQWMAVWDKESTHQVLRLVRRNE